MNWFLSLISLRIIDNEHGKVTCSNSLIDLGSVSQHSFTALRLVLRRLYYSLSGG